MTKAKLRKMIRRLERENFALIIECNAARARAGEAQEALNDLPRGFHYFIGGKPLFGALNPDDKSSALDG